MIGYPVLDVGLSRLAKPDKIPCDAMCDQRNVWKNIPPHVRRGGIPV
jgi:hypothetical protein